jgi:YegS/Rv2252/BmrU family lipid kinase
MKKRLLFVYNPNAGRKRIKECLDDIITEFCKEDIEVVVCPTKKSGDATVTVKEYEDDETCFMVACAGGDGTLHEIVNGMMLRNKRIPITYMPMGSTNDFGGSLGIPKDITEAAKLVNTGKQFPCDIGRLNSEYFVYTACFGVFTETSYATPQNLKNSLGHFAYVLNGATELTKIQRYQVKVEFDDSVVEGKFIFGSVSSTASIGGFRPITPEDVEFDDGLYELVLIKDAKFYEFPKLANDLLRGTYSANENIVYARVNKVKFTSENPVPWCVDGEFGGNFCEAGIEIYKQAVTFMIPSSKSSEEPIEYDENLFTAHRIEEFKKNSMMYDEDSTEFLQN